MEKELKLKKQKKLKYIYFALKFMKGKMDLLQKIVNNLSYHAINVNYHTLKLEFIYKL